MTKDLTIVVKIRNAERRVSEERKFFFGCLNNERVVEWVKALKQKKYLKMGTGIIFLTKKLHSWNSDSDSD